MTPKRSAGSKKPGDSKLALVRPQSVSAGVVGLGLMGRSIVACLLVAGHRVVGVTEKLDRSDARRHVGALLREMKHERLFFGDPRAVVENLQLSEDFSALGNCEIVIESVPEDIEVKHAVIRKVEAVVSPKALIGSNTSALPISLLQRGAEHPERIMGIHLAEPAHVSRFMEVICGDQTNPESAERVINLAKRWNKDPTFVRRDLPGFITNRIMYSMLREAFHLVEAGYATPADVDRSIRNDYGYWTTFAGLFRYMDLTGIPAYMAVMRNLLPELNCDKEVPELMRKVVASGARGVANAKGFYKYTPAEAKRWEKKFLKFSYEIRALAQKYQE